LNPLSQLVRQPVVDRTGLQGGFDYELTFAERLKGGATPPADADAASVFTALQEQLGLKLEPVRAPVQVLVVDHVAMEDTDSMAIVASESGGLVAQVIYIGRERTSLNVEAGLIRANDGYTEYPAPRRDYWNTVVLPCVADTSIERVGA
jgi:hypothetical protein